MTNSVIAVTASSGRLGRAILNGVVQRFGSDHVIGIARDPQRIQVSRIEKRAADYNSVEQYASALRGVDTCILISAPFVPGTDRVTMHRNVIEAARLAGVRKLIASSVIGGDGIDTLFEENQKINRQLDADVQSSGLEWVVARNGLYIDLDLIHIRQAEKTGVYSNCVGTGDAGYISIAELAAAYVALAGREDMNGQILNITAGNFSQADLVAAANLAFDINVSYEQTSLDDTMMRLMKLPHISARGESVAQMLSGCLECITRGEFNVPSDFEKVCGRPPRSLVAMMEEIRASN